MSTKYSDVKDVPTALLARRLEQLSDAVTKGRDAVDKEFTMRVPPEVDRDADIVLSEAARRLKEAFSLVVFGSDDHAPPFRALPASEIIQKLREIL